MAYIGNAPTNVPLTSADILDGTIQTADLEDNIITSAKISNGTITASDLDLTDNYDFTGTVTGAGFATDELFRYGLTSDQSLANATTVKINLNKAIVSNSNFDTTTNYRYTVPSGKAGKYIIGASGNWLSAGDFNNCMFIIYKNGTGLTSSNIRQEHYENHYVDMLVELEVGDYIELYARQESGGSVSFRASDGTAFLQGYRISE